MGGIARRCAAIFLKAHEELAAAWLTKGASPPPPGLSPGDVIRVAVCHRRPLAERVLRTLPGSASMVTLASAIGKCHFYRRAAAAVGSFPGVLHLTPIERGVTGVPAAAGSPTVRRRELGAILRALRTQKGWTAEQVAERLLISPSKVSRLEKGQRGASARDIRDLCDLYGVGGDQRQELMDLAAAGKQQTWWQARVLPYSTYVGLETEATAISDYGLGLVPGLLQTTDYARAVFSRTVPHLPPDVARQRLAGRMARQRLLTSENPPQFHTVIDESVLRRVVGGRAVMHAQLERLLELSQLPNVFIRVAPYEAGAMAVNNNKFIILSLKQPLIGLVFIEGLTGDLYLENKYDIDVYTQAFSEMTDLAASPAETRAIIASISEIYQP
jgi:transcriptional regulator with XRE-family HTH domain